MIYQPEASYFLIPAVLIGVVVGWAAQKVALVAAHRRVLRLTVEKEMLETELQKARDDHAHAGERRVERFLGRPHFVHADLDGGFMEVPDSWTTKPFARVRWHEDGGDPPMFGFVLERDQSDTVVGELMLRDAPPMPDPEIRAACNGYYDDPEVLHGAGS